VRPSAPEGRRKNKRVKKRTQGDPKGGGTIRPKAGLEPTTLIYEQVGAGSRSKTRKGVWPLAEEIRHKRSTLGRNWDSKPSTVSVETVLLGRVPSIGSQGIPEAVWRHRGGGEGNHKQDPCQGKKGQQHQK